jgi:hypothetical protein
MLHETVDCSLLAPSFGLRSPVYEILNWQRNSVFCNHRVIQAVVGQTVVAQDAGVTQ